MKLAVTLALVLIGAPASLAQEAGGWVFGIAIGTGERAGLFVRFYPVADVGAEAHALLVPLPDLASVGFGGGLVGHPFHDDRLAFYIGASRLASQYLGGGARRYGIALGAGYEPFQGEAARDRLMARFSLSLARRQASGREADLPYGEVGEWGRWRLRPGGQVGTGRVL